MSTMKGVIVEAAGAPYQVVDDLEIPEPGTNQILVKSISTAINPVYVTSVFLRNLRYLHSQACTVLSMLILIAV